MSTKLIMALAALALGLLIQAAPARACSCDFLDRNLPLEQQVSKARREATVVFTGKVLEVTQPEGSFARIVRIQVDRAWKGVNIGELTIATGLGNGDCGYGFTLGHSYLVYAHGDSVESLSTNRCSRTVPLGAGGDLEFLGVPEYAPGETKSLSLLTYSIPLARFYLR